MEFLKWVAYGVAMGFTIWVKHGFLHMGYSRVFNGKHHVGTIWEFSYGMHMEFIIWASYGLLHVGFIRVINVRHHMGNIWDLSNGLHMGLQWEKPHG